MTIRSDVFEYSFGSLYLTVNPKLESYRDRFNIPSLFWGFWYRYVSYLYEDYNNSEAVANHISQMIQTLKAQTLLWVK
jgi:hypothetical protein